MLVEQSVSVLADHLRAAIANKDWSRAHGHIDRLKSIVLEGVARNDSAAIQSAGAALQSTGQFLELSKRVRMKMDALALAWQLRADVVTATLAQRIRPALPLEDEESKDVSKL